MATQFGGNCSEELNTLQNHSVDLVISTVPPDTKFRLPSHLLKKDMVIIELVYYPRYTELLKQAAEIGCAFVEGSEILFAQGLKQFEIWTGKNAPRREMARALVEVHNEGALKEKTPLLFSESL